jgi:hypothetical protein
MFIGGLTPAVTLALGYGFVLPRQVSAMSKVDALLT